MNFHKIHKFETLSSRKQAWYCLVSSCYATCLKISCMTLLQLHKKWLSKYQLQQEIKHEHISLWFHFWRKNEASTMILLQVNTVCSTLSCSKYTLLHFMDMGVQHLHVFQCRYDTRNSILEWSILLIDNSNRRFGYNYVSSFPNFLGSLPYLFGY